MPRYIKKPFTVVSAHRVGGTRAEVDAFLAWVKAQTSGNGGLPFFARPDDRFVKGDDGKLHHMTAVEFEAQYAVPPKHEDD